jgi:hypothetical protein
MRQARLSLQLAKDRVFVCKQVAEQSDVVFFSHAETCFLLWTEDAWC